VIYIITILKISDGYIFIHRYRRFLKSFTTIDYSIAENSFTTISQQILVVDDQQFTAKKCHQTLTVVHQDQMLAEVVKSRPP